MAAISITHSPANVIINIDRAAIAPERLEQALWQLRQTLEAVPNLENDPFYLEPVSDEEQAEIEAMLRSIPSEDREIAYTERVSLMTGEIL